ncbi:AMP-binding protein [Gandjariella thermophila]|uniref:Long-chain acyl-CoA synthetase n=1 Tax=Gandjariella thermophila TaxID=1931992 RepID=A0A4D4J4B9_9PSEU|nr:AMP-binding protein [Gandjariella thermophila]GDY29469.1 long-chain acyl-CoA synthetase [Gandjariella thermophila]
MTDAGSAAARNVADLVRSAARRSPDQPALIEATSGRGYSWSEVDRAVDAEARRLAVRGAQPGDRVAVRLPNRPEFCVAALGALRAGCVAMPIGPGMTARETGRILTESGARLLVGETDPATGAAGVTVLDPPALDVGEQPEVAAGTGGEDLAVLVYTSGASGVPRGVMLSHRALLANLEQCAALRPAPVTAADRVLLALPLFHAYGLGPGLLQVCHAGACAVLLDRFEPAAALAAIERHLVTTVIGVPTMYRALLQLPTERLHAGLATVRLFTSGAAPLPPEVLDGIREVTGLGVYEGYGLSETGPVLTTTLAGGQPKPGSVGRPVPGVELRLVDAAGEPLEDLAELVDEDELGEEPGGTGLVSVRGRNLFSGYWPDGHGGPDADGWFSTGDVGYLDADGDLHLVDRLNDLIIVSGFNVYPREVEQVLCELPEVAEAAAVAVPDERTGESVKAVIVLRDGASLTEEAVVAHCAERLAKFKVPTAVEFASALPHTPTGKLARRRLRTA